ncbi:OB-fold domain-containing protein [Neobacillus niacini]|uniref:Zn-ribbon domain-containing OB-fold protein n=1 Tax=Neobacillus niacini TaxID=86668 RepID=UPI002FFF79E7
MVLDDLLYSIDSDTRPYWEATKNEELLIQYCSHCESHQFYPRIVCKNCLSDVKWVKAKGTGHVYSYSVIHRVFSPEFQAKVPFIIALVELDEGPRMMTNLIDVEDSELKVGLKVQVDFQERIGEYRLPKFRPFK